MAGPPLPTEASFVSGSPELTRLSPTMTSRKLQALAFIRHFYARWGQSPTLGEIAAALKISRKRAHELVGQLATEKMVEVVAGKPRGIRLLETGEELSEAEILVRLSAMGWTIGDGDHVIQPPGSVFAADPSNPTAVGYPLTDKGLHVLPFLDFKVEDEAAGSSGQANES